jgi:hypothetical protein
MAKDRNTVAKRQREMERKRKADEKRQHRARRKQHAEGPSGTERVPEAEQLSERTDPPSTLSSTELSVLEVFRRFRMGPGQMLCFSRADVEALHAPLKELANNGLLVAEEFNGGYSLTPAGFNAMKDVP